MHQPDYYWSQRSNFQYRRRHRNPHSPHTTDHKAPNEQEQEVGTRAALWYRILVSFHSFWSLKVLANQFQRMRYKRYQTQILREIWEEFRSNLWVWSCSKIELFNWYQTSGDYIDVVKWSVIEEFTAVLCTALPSLRSVFRHTFGLLSDALRSLTGSFSVRGDHSQNPADKASSVQSLTTDPKHRHSSSIDSGLEIRRTIETLVTTDPKRASELLEGWGGKKKI